MATTPPWSLINLASGMTVRVKLSRDRQRLFVLATTETHRIDELRDD